KFHTARTEGNYNNKIGLPISMLLMDPDTEVGVFELGSSRPGEIDELARILRPTCGIVTSVGPAHMEFFESVEAIAREKSALLMNLPSTGVAVFDKGGEYFDIMKECVPCRVITVALRGDADYTCDTVNAKNVMTVLEHSSGNKVELPVPLPGEHNIVNMLFAVAIGREFGVSWPDIAEKLASFKHLPMRWECMHIGNITVINDAYNANPLSMRAALRTFAKMGDHLKWLVVGGMLELGACERQAHIELGKFIADIMVGGGGWKGMIAVGALGRLIADGAESGGLSNNSIAWCPDNASATNALYERASSGDTVLLKASRGIHLEEIVEGLLERYVVI
ncbi:MAG: UDP-N-acetylmuramoyl-tripeptide--D-alanyl-D-alanine ligase, partial [Lentisphaerae bacterium]|nr:UDP-N-acetylmuramoyl-tripeptide--D-alanyl-D-alanine ligase [Lentisphaerota bacterium]